MRIFNIPKCFNCFIPWKSENLIQKLKDESRKSVTVLSSEGEFQYSIQSIEIFNKTTLIKKVASAKSATPAAPTTAAPTTAVPTTAAPAPAKPAPTVIYTCMSPGGTTANPTSSGNCQNGYTLTKF
jgi:hypothetical protein